MTRSDNSLTGATQPGVDRPHSHARTFRRWGPLCVLSAAALSLGGCTHFTQHAPARAQGAAIGHPFDHVLIVVLENGGYKEALATSYLKTLAQRGRLLSNFHAVAHPSYPNYIAMVTGRRVRTRGDFVAMLRVPSIADPLEAHGLTWRQYAEGMPVPCDTHDTGLYKRKHVPFMSFTAIVSNPTRCANVVPAKAFNPAQLPSYAFYTPNMRNDGHDTGVPYGVHWLQGFLDPLLAAGRLLPRTLVVVTFDESEGASATNHVYTVLLGDAVQPGPADTTYYDHFDLLRTVEANFALPPIGPADSAAQPISGVWSR